MKWWWRGVKGQREETRKKKQDKRNRIKEGTKGQSDKGTKWRSCEAARGRNAKYKTYFPGDLTLRLKCVKNLPFRCKNINTFARSELMKLCVTNNKVVLSLKENIMVKFCKTANKFLFSPPSR